MRMWLGAAAAVALAAAMAATPAAAITLTFNVNAESVSDGSDFTPFSFQETWTWNDPTYLRIPSPNHGPVQQYLEGPATVSPASQVTAAQGVFAGVDLGQPNTTGSVFDTVGNNTLVFILRSQANSDEVVDVRERGDFDDVHREGLYIRSVQFVIFGTETFDLPDISDEAQIRGFLTGRALNWREFAGFRFVDQSSSPYEPFTNRVYSGTATLVDGAAVAVPEPATWALMIGGFGAAGAMLRRRRAVVA